MYMGKPARQRSTNQCSLRAVRKISNHFQTEKEIDACMPSEQNQMTIEKFKATEWIIEDVWKTSHFCTAQGLS